ncbi:MAG: PKD domain-containing protein [Bacteroidota bacterium]
MKTLSIVVLFISAIFFAVPLYAQLSFAENKGQWDSKVDFKVNIQSGAFFMEKNGFTVLLNHPDDIQKFSEQIHGHSHNDVKKGESPRKNLMKFGDPVTIRSHAYKAIFVGASNNVQILPEKILPTYDNYYIGNDKTKWQSDCKSYQAVVYKNIYPNIDVRYYTDAGTLKYDIIVNPGGNVNDIAMQYQGVEMLSIKNEELLIQTSVGEIKELYPYTYQLTKTGREVLNAKYQLKNNIVKFNIKNYSPDATIVIDPTLIFSTFTGSTADNWGYTATPGPGGTMFAAGIVFGTGYPVSQGAFSRTFNGGIDEDGNGPYDIALIKLSANGSNRLYGTYLGGNGNEQPHSMMSDAQGNLVLAGRSNSNNGSLAFPTTTAPQGPLGGYDIVITKFNAGGTALIGSVKIGGTGDDGVNIKPKYVSLSGIAPFGQTDGAFETRRNYGDDARSEVILDGNNNILLASCTQSSNFPVRGAFQSTFGQGRQDGVVLKFTPNLSSMIFSSYFGGNGSDACFVLSINPFTGNIYVAGATTSTDLPGDKNGVITATYQGGEADGFITEINPSGSAIIKTTYQGTSGDDLVYGIQFDREGFPYIMGTTTGSWKVINAPYNRPGGKQFISKLQPDLSAYVYSTVFGTNSTVPNISPIAFLVDRCQNVYVSGWGGGINVSKQYPSAGTRGLPVTANAIKSGTDGDDFYFFVLEKNAASQLFGSFFGQTNGQLGDHVDGGTSRFDANGIIYQALCANCGGPTTLGFFPTTPGAWARTNPSPSCNEAAVKIEMNFGGITTGIKATINGKYDTVGCVPLTIAFADTVAKGKQYVWNFGDGTGDQVVTNPNTTHTFNNVGSYRVRLIAIDSATCNIADTAYVTIKVGNNIVSPNFFAQKIGDCNSLTFQFTNTTTAINPIYNDSSFLWDFGDGTPPLKAGLNNVTHTYLSVGTYNVILTVVDTIFCNAPDTAARSIRLANNVEAAFTTPDKGCLPYSALFTNTSLGGTDFIWNFGDGSPTSTDINPVHTYTRTGTFTITLIAIDLFTCNQRDTATFTIEVLAIPTANFSFTPVVPKINTPTLFINSSLNATNYLWQFGDGDSSIEANPKHQFNATDTFTVCLLAMNNAGCVDTICKDVSALVEPLLDVPNAFTPNSHDINSIIKVEGFGIAKMSWKIYNRWGQLLFTSTSPKIGWNGIYKNKIQPMDVYTYTLDVEMFDGKKIRRTGDITLLR